MSALKRFSFFLVRHRLDDLEKEMSLIFVGDTVRHRLDDLEMT